MLPYLFESLKHKIACKFVRTILSLGFRICVFFTNALNYVLKDPFWSDKPVNSSQVYYRQFRLPPKNHKKSRIYFSVMEFWAEELKP